MTKKRDFWVEIGFLGGCWMVWRAQNPILGVLDAEKRVVERYGGTRCNFFPLSW